MHIQLSEFITILSDIEQRHGGSCDVILVNGSAEAGIDGARFDNNSGIPRVHVLAASCLLPEKPESDPEADAPRL